MCDHPDREAAMTVIARDDQGTPTVWCDPCLAPLVRALNDAGMSTVASCCGHGRRPSTVALADGRELLVMGFEEARRVDGLWPDIVADVRPADPNDARCPDCECTMASHKYGTPHRACPECTLRVEARHGDQQAQAGWGAAESWRPSGPETGAVTDEQHQAAAIAFGNAIGDGKTWEQALRAALGAARHEQENDDG